MNIPEVTEYVKPSNHCCLPQHKTWLEIASKAETVGLNFNMEYTQKDADIFNSYPFKFLCEKVDQLEEQLEVTRLAIRHLPKEDK